MKKEPITLRLNNFATGRTVILFFILYLVMQLSMIVIVSPLLSNYSEKLPLDAHFNYSTEEVYEFISSLSEDGKNIYIILGLYDTVFPVIYAFFYTLLVIYIYKKAAIENFYIYKLRFLPLLAGLFDIAENISIHIMIKNYPQKFPLIANFANVCTILKFIWIPLTLILIIVGLVFLIIKKTKNIKKEQV